MAGILGALLEQMAAKEAWIEKLKKEIEETKRVEAENPLILWAHLVSQHATGIMPNWSLEDLLEAHRHEHEGPGTIRNHDESDRSFTMKSLVEVLTEMGEMGDE